MSKKMLSGRPTDYEEKTNRLKNAKEKSKTKKTIAGKNPIAGKDKEDY